MTGQDVINIAYSRSKRAQPKVDASDPELLIVLNETMSRYVSVGSNVNRSWFMEQLTVGWSATPGGWARPDRAEIVYRIEAAGELVRRVPFDDRNSQKGLRRVYRMGGWYYPVDRIPGPWAGDALAMFCAMQPPQLASVEEELPDVWPKGHETLLGLEIGIFLAQKDGRDGSGNTPNDVGALTAQRDQSAQKFFGFLQHEDVGTIHRKARERAAVPGGVR